MSLVSDRADGSTRDSDLVNNSDDVRKEALIKYLTESEKVIFENKPAIKIEYLTKACFRKFERKTVVYTYKLLNMKNLLI